MRDSRVLGRLAIFPKYLSSETNVFDPEQLFRFPPVKGFCCSTDFYGFSLACEILAGSTKGMHGYGQRSTAVQNAAYEERTGQEPDPASEYVGFFRFDAEVINNLEAPRHSFEIVWLPEHNEICHYQLELRPLEPSGKATRKRNAHERIALSNRIFQDIKEFVKMDDSGYSEDLKVELDSLVAELPQDVVT